MWFNRFFLASILFFLNFQLDAATRWINDHIQDTGAVLDKGGTTLDVPPAVVRVDSVGSERSVPHLPPHMQHIGSSVPPASSPRVLSEDGAFDSAQRGARSHPAHTVHLASPLRSSELDSYMTLFRGSSANSKLPLTARRLKEKTHQTQGGLEVEMTAVGSLSPRGSSRRLISPLPSHEESIEPLLEEGETPPGEASSTVPLPGVVDGEVGNVAAPPADQIHAPNLAATVNNGALRSSASSIELPLPAPDHSGDALQPGGHNFLELPLPISPDSEGVAEGRSPVSLRRISVQTDGEQESAEVGKGSMASAAVELLSNGGAAAPAVDQAHGVASLPQGPAPQETQRNKTILEWLGRASWAACGVVGPIVGKAIVHPSLFPALTAGYFLTVYAEWKSLVTAYATVNAIAQSNQAIMGNEVTTLNGQVSSFQSQIATLTTQVTTLQEQLSVSVPAAAFASLQTQLATFTQQVIDLEAEITSLQADKNALKAEITQLEANGATVAASFATVSAGLQSDIAALNTQVAALQGQLSASVSASVFASLQGKFANLNQYVTRLEGEITSLQADKNALTAEITQLEASEAMVATSFTTVNAGLQSQIAMLNTQVSTLQEQLVTSVPAAAFASLQTQLATFTQQVTDLEAEIASLQADKNALKAEITQLEANGATVAASFATVSAGLQSDIAALNIQVATLQGQLSASVPTSVFTSLKKKTTSLTQYVTRLEIEITSLQAEITSLQADKNALTAEITQLETTEGTIASSLGGLSGQTATLTTQMSSLGGNMGYVVDQLNSISGAINQLVAAQGRGFTSHFDAPRVQRKPTKANIWKRNRLSSRDIGSLALLPVPPSFADYLKADLISFQPNVTTCLKMLALTAGLCKVGHLGILAVRK